MVAQAAVLVLDHQRLLALEVLFDVHEYGSQACRKGDIVAVDDGLKLLNEEPVIAVDDLVVQQQQGPKRRGRGGSGLRRCRGVETVWHETAFMHTTCRDTPLSKARNSALRYAARMASRLLPLRIACERTFLCICAAITWTACTSDTEPTQTSGSAVQPNTPQGSTFSPSFTFESGPVRPLALSPDGTRLFTANTANSSLDVLAVEDTGLRPVSSTYVGVDPVAVAARSNDEVWVVNHVSDSVSVVDVRSEPPRVVRTLLVGDEPSDIVFAGPQRNRAFITAAHRGQQRTDPSLAAVPGAGDPELTTAGVGRADVWVFDADDLGSSVGGTPLAIVSLFGDTPRALTVTKDGSTVYAAVFKSGNQTMVTSPELPCPGFDSPTQSSPCMVGPVAVPGAPPGPATNYAGVQAPAVSMILKTDGEGVWRDLLGRDWSAATAFSLPDRDVFAIDAASLQTTATFAHVGTTLFGMTVNPANGHVYVSNTEARNELRFEGPGTYAGETLEGHLAESRISVLSDDEVIARRLNKHIDYTKLPAPEGTAAHSLATPLDLVVSGDGSTLYVAAFGSSKIGVLSTEALERNALDPARDSANYIALSGGGPAGLVLDETRGKLYVTTRFDTGISVVDLAGRRELSHLTLSNPEPTEVSSGRHLLYDATLSSSNGEAACASCHMFGDADHLAWDLGNPDEDVINSPVTIKLIVGVPRDINGTGQPTSVHPMKGPMTTQTLRGLANHGAMHWRGDRVSGFFGTDKRTAPPYDAALAFDNFIMAFNSLLGLGPQFPVDDMRRLRAFTFAIQMPPNPIRALDNSLNDQQAAGRQFFLGCAGTDASTGKPVQCDADGKILSGFGHLSDGVAFPDLGFTCEGCHVLDPAQGYFGTDGQFSFEALPQIAKIPQLRNLYDKVGMFGEVEQPGANDLDNGHKGPQVRGTGFQHDGSADTLFRFLQAKVFNANGDGIGFTGGDAQRREVEQYLLAFDSDLAPIVGQQVTLRSDNADAVGPRIDLFLARAAAPFTSKLLGAGANECDLVARLVRAGQQVNYHLRADQVFIADDGSAALSDAELRALAAVAGQEITYTCLPWGWAAPAPQ